MLDGKTPRQAVKTKKSRAQVIGWLKYLENSEYRLASQHGHEPHDMSWMWRGATSPGEARREKRSHTTRRDTTCCPPHPGYGPVTVPELGSFCKVQAVLQPHVDTPADLPFLVLR